MSGIDDVIAKAADEGVHWYAFDREDGTFVVGFTVEPLGIYGDQKHWAGYGRSLEEAASAAMDDADEAIFQQRSEESR